MSETPATLAPVTETYSAAQARRMALAAQGFTRARPAAVAPRHVHRVMDRLGVLQIDSVNVFARSHYMPLFSRLGAYDPALLERMFHARTTHYIEYLAHEATFVPVEDWPLWRFRMDDYRRRWEKNPTPGPLRTGARSTGCATSCPPAARCAPSICATTRPENAARGGTGTTRSSPSSTSGAPAMSRSAGAAGSSASTPSPSR